MLAKIVRLGHLALLKNKLMNFLDWIHLRLPPLNKVIRLILWPLSGYIIFYFCLYLGYEYFFYEIVQTTDSPLFEPGLQLGTIIGVGGLALLLRFSVLRLFGDLIVDSSEAINKFIQKKIPVNSRSIQFINFMLLSLILLVIVTYFLNQNIRQIAWYYEETPPIYADDIALSLNNIDTNSKTIDARFTTWFAGENNTLLEDVPYIQVDGELLPVIEGRVRDNIQITYSGNDYYFPFNRYDVEFFSISLPNGGSFSDNLKFTVYSDSSAFVLQKGSDYGTGLYNFSVSYAPYYKILVIAVIVSLIGFLWGMWKARVRGQVIDLAIGTFAALIALRTFLIPSGIDSPIFLDQIIIFYVVILSLSIYKKGFVTFE
ncbi:MAG: hypothetical protein H6657_10180 [Ardenticatenaceae bacterium]|nr:hypothetical protein [Ardenticatenaceae bacterium]